MIHFLVGKPRNGKSLRAMMHIYEQLTTTHRHVVTNMVLDLDRLQSLLIERGHPQIDVRSRVRMLTDEETKDFWLYRGCGYNLEKCEGYDDKKSQSRMDYAPLVADPRFWVERDTADPESVPVMRGTCYVIDECHTLWPARGWQGTPRHTDFYNSQHAKLNDIVFFITQNTKLVDSNFLRLAQDFTYCRNHRLEKHGRFRGDNKFTGHTYPGPISSDREVTLNVETYKLDLALAACYDTSAGVGMPGGGAADAGYRAKGVPLKMVWVGLAAVLVASWFAFTWAIPKFTRTFIAPALGAVAVEEPARADVETVGAPMLPEAAPAAPADLVGAPAAPAEIHPTGFAMRSGVVFIQMSDGTRRWYSSARRTLSDGIEGVTPVSVLLDGRKLYIKPASRPDTSADGENPGA